MPGGSLCELIFPEVLFELNQCETPEPAQIVVIYPVGRRILGHGRDILEVIKVVLMKFNFAIIELLNTLALIHRVGFLVADAKVILPDFNDKKSYLLFTRSGTNPGCNAFYAIGMNHFDFDL
jgi:hypothetical protein